MLRNFECFVLVFVVFYSSLIPLFRANGHEKRGFEWSTFSLKLKSIYSKVGGYAPEYVQKVAGIKGFPPLFKKREVYLKPFIGTYTNNSN